MLSFLCTALTALALSPLALALPLPDHQHEKRFSGSRITFYDTEVGLGACGNFNPNSAWTVALNTEQFGNSYPSPECGKTVTISYGGKTAQAVIQDACPTCPYGALDLSIGLFEYFAHQDVGEFTAEWHYGGGAPPPPPPPPPPSTSKEPEPTSTWQPPSPTSTWVEPTTSWTPEPEPSTSTTPTSTWIPPTSTTSESSTSSTASSTTVTSASSSIISTSSASSSVTATATRSSLALTSSAASAAPSALSAAGTADGSITSHAHDNNFQMLTDVIINVGRLVVLSDTT